MTTHVIDLDDENEGWLNEDNRTASVDGMAKRVYRRYVELVGGVVVEGPDSPDVSSH
jgi:hypothetical protein